MINDEANEVIKQLFDLLKNRYQNNFESMKGSEFGFDYVHLLYYKCYKINANRGGSYIDSPDWIKSKKATTNPINKKDNKCFQYAVTVALNHELTAYVSKNNSYREKQVILLMILNDVGQRWHYLAVKKLSALLRGITSKNNGDF